MFYSSNYKGDKITIKNFYSKSFEQCLDLLEKINKIENKCSHHIVNLVKLIMIIKNVLLKILEVIYN